MNEWHRLTVRNWRAFCMSRRLAATSASCRRGGEREMKIVGVLPGSQHQQQQQGGDVNSYVVKWTGARRTARLLARRCSVVNFHKLHISATSSVRPRYYTTRRTAGAARHHIVSSRTTTHVDRRPANLSDTRKCLIDAVIHDVLGRDAWIRAVANLSREREREREQQKYCWKFQAFD